ncbi:mersacidin/lichenicidin family type 2 lantibiotic [Amycolatopsis sp. 195334CR]|uniref:mersacidin/lichenicidin family type 2 lantibiotic n=1 Tax=Amycolatopsis sp. 195334CR TaxID=2814588 RepID=UPI001A8E533F|nr:mersacidin/lichenicidin family type 2 lantibiotic [Amycolatopsis sp. 195334CR]MBN6033674.1 mersacidin/lichenicidin family type 2 lantibiotic [Amycolatopsis sp. 195334CR]
MSNTLVRAWKDPEYREGLPTAPAHPAGVADPQRLELHDLGFAGGAALSGVTCVTKTSTFTIPAWCVFSLAIC